MVVWGEVLNKSGLVVIWAKSMPQLSVSLPSLAGFPTVANRIFSAPVHSLSLNWSSLCFVAFLTFGFSKHIATGPEVLHFSARIRRKAGGVWWWYVMVVGGVWWWYVIAVGVDVGDRKCRESMWSCGDR